MQYALFLVTLGLFVVLWVRIDAVARQRAPAALRAEIEDLRTVVEMQGKRIRSELGSLWKRVPVRVAPADDEEPDEPSTPKRDIQAPGDTSFDQMLALQSRPSVGPQ